VNFKCDFAEELVTLVELASRADNIDKGMLCRAAIRVINNPPAATPYLIGLSVGLRVYGLRMLFEAICVQYPTAMNIPPAFRNPRGRLKTATTARRAVPRGSR
jgi:hypothetical protein